jgi:hypothetical protein
LKHSDLALGQIAENRIAGATGLKGKTLESSSVCEPMFERTSAVVSLKRDRRNTLDKTRKEIIILPSVQSESTLTTE